MPTRQNLQDVLKKKLWIVTGKGGVGKTTLATALGLLSAREGLKTLLVETHGLNHLGQLLEVGTVGYKGLRTRKNLDLIQITPEEAFEEYVLQQVRFRFVYNTVFNNQYVRHFIDAAPGLIELLTIGKIWSLVGDPSIKWGKKKPYDLVIVDAPSTGHGLSLLTVPQIVVNAIRVGPLKTKSQQIMELLRDADKSMVWLATLPEEMPVNEAVEMADKLESEVKMALGPIILNAVWPTILDESAIEEIEKTKLSLPMFEVYRKRSEQSAHYRDLLRSQFSGRQVLEMPLVYQAMTPLGLAQRLSEVLYQGLSHEP